MTPLSRTPPQRGGASASPAPEHQGGRGGGRRWPRRLLALVATAAATWLVATGIAGAGWEEVRAVDLGVLELDYPYLAASVVLLLLAFVLAAWFWSGLLAGFGEPRLGLAPAASMVLISNLGRYVPGKVWQLAGLAALARRAGRAGVPAGAAAVAGQGLHLAGAALVGGWAAAGLFSAGGSTGPSGMTGLPPAWMLAAIAAAVALLAWAFLRYGPPMPTALHWRRALRWFPGYAANWLVLGGAFYCLGRGTGLAVPYWAGASAFAGAYFIGYVSWFAPAGLGVREGFLVAFLSPLLGPENSIALAALQRVWITATEVLGAAVGALCFRLPAAAPDVAQAP